MTEDSAASRRPVRIHLEVPGYGFLCRYGAPPRGIQDHEVVDIPMCPGCLAAMDVLLTDLMWINCAGPDLNLPDGVTLLKEDPEWAAYLGSRAPDEGKIEFGAWTIAREEREEYLHAEGGSPCALYRHFDADDVLLYVGITGDADARREQHVKSSPWAEFAVRETCEWFESREAAATAERVAIESELPLFNRAFSGPDRDQRVIEYAVRRQAWHLLQPV